MKTICVLARKGGVGKSTLSFHLAGLADQCLLVDLDDQGSCGVWHANRADKHRPAYINHAAVLNTGLAAVLAAARKTGSRYAIIDTPPHSTAEVSSAVAVADVVVIPLEASEFSLAAVQPTLAVANAHGKPIVLVLSRAEPGERETRETLAMLQGAGLPHTVVHSRVALKRTIPSGSTVFEAGGDPKACAEIERVWTLIQEALK